MFLNPSCNHISGRMYLFLIQIPGRICCKDQHKNTLIVLLQYIIIVDTILYVILSCFVELFQCIIISVSRLQKNNTMAKKQKAPKWNNKDTELLNKRFDNGEIPYKNLSPETIKAVLKQFYPDRNYDCFSKIIKQKAKKYILDFELQNARKTGKFCFFDSCFLFE